MEPTHTALTIVSRLQAQLDLLKQGQLPASGLSAWVSAEPALLQALPPKYSVVLHDLLNRLEAGAMFSEESCSFSQKDIHDSLQLWVNKATETLQKQ